MRLDGAVALVAGANRGLGRSLVKALAEASVPRIHASARGPFQLPDFGLRTSVLPLELDITDSAQVARWASTEIGAIGKGALYKEPFICLFLHRAQ